MGTLKFEWDERKNAANRRKHGISFAEAKTAFLDDNARVIPDPEHSDYEERFVLLGLSISLRCWSCVTAIGTAAKSSASSRPAKRTGMKSSNITGGYDEETLRLFKVGQESLSQ